jgi:hypothetical protein
MRLFPRFISFLLTPILIVGPLSAQTSQVPSASPSGSAPVEALLLRVVEGESADVAAGSRALKGFIVEVTDSSGAAVSDAAIAFRLPDVAPTGMFSDGTHAAVAYTDQTGRAKITGIQWNATPGAVAIRVTATKGTAHAGILIQQTLAPVDIGALAPPLSPTAHQELPSQVAPLSLPAAPPVGTQPVAKAATPGQPATTTPSLDTHLPPRNPEPAVSVTNASTGASRHSSKTKWIILAAVAAGAAGAGIAMMGKKSSSSSAATTPGLSIGAPGISIGHP